MVPWILATCAVALAVAASLAARRAARSLHAPLIHPLETAISLGAALGALAALPRADHAPWLVEAGPITIPVIAGVLLVGLALCLARDDAPWPSALDAILLGVAWVIMVAVCAAGGIGLAEGAAIGIVLGTLTWFRPAPDAAHPPTRAHPRPLAGALALFWAASFCAMLAVGLDLPPLVAWVTMAAATLGLLVPLAIRDPRVPVATAVAAPLSGIAAFTVIRIVVLACVSGSAVRALGERWIVGFAEVLASDPVALLPSGTVPERCAAGAALGAAICASRLSKDARQLLGVLVVIAGCVVAAISIRT